MSSWLDRARRAVVAGGGAVKAPVGFVHDIVTAPFRDDEVDGVIGTVLDISTRRGGEFLGATLGPEGVGGEIIGGMPVGVRNVVKGGTEPVFKGLDAVYRELVSEPLATASTLESIAELPGSDGYSELFRPDNWRKAYKIAQTRSPGQAAALAAGHVDIFDDQALAVAEATDWYQLMSGSIDAASRILLDPSIFAGKAVAAKRGVSFATDLASGKTVLLSRPIRTVEDRNRFIGSSAYEKFRESTKGWDATQLRTTYFRDNEQGAVISTLLADANKIANNEERVAAHSNVMKALMGDGYAKEALAESQVALNGALERALGRRTYLGRFGADDFDEATLSDELAITNREIDELGLRMQSEAYVATRGSMADAPLRELPRYSKFQAAKQASITALTEAPDGAGRVREVVMQYNPLSATLRTATTWTPGGNVGVVSMHDPAGDKQLLRFVQQKSAGFKDEDITSFTDRYMRAGTEMERSAIWHEAEQQAVRNLANKHGIKDLEEVEKLVAAARDGRRRTDRIANLNGRVYDGKDTSKITFPESGNVVEIPLLNTQLQNVHFVKDLREIDRALGRIGQYMAQHKNVQRLADLPGDLVAAYMKVWKPGTLLRLVWPLRVISDEQFRIMAKIGVMANTKNLIHVGGQHVSDVFKRVDKELRVPGRRDFEYKGYGSHELQPAFGSLPGGPKNLFAALNKSRGELSALYGNTERALLQRLRGEAPDGNMSMTGQWRTIRPTDPEEAGSYAAAWEHAVNNQIGKDKLARRFLKGKSVDEAVDWLTNDVAGQAYARRNPIRARNLEQWAADVEDQVMRYTLNGNDEIRDLALKGNAKHDVLARLEQDPQKRPVVHGEILEQSMGRGVMGIWSDIITKGYEVLGEKPSGFLSRNPFFDHVYRDEMKRLIDLHEGPRLLQGQLDEMAEGARRYALNQTRELLYDLAEQSDLERIARFFMPFYGAWQEVISRWAGLAVENPAFVARTAQIWQSPERAGIVTDENGAQIHEDGTATGADGQPVEPGKDRYINMPLNIDLPGPLPHINLARGGTETKSTFAFNKKSLNLVLSGPPGVGPVVQVPVNEIVKQRPDLQDSVKFILPFGTTQDNSDILLPTPWKRLKQTIDGEDDRTYRNQLMRIYWDKMVDYNLGLRTDPPTYDEAKNEADSLAKLRMVTGFISPAQFTYKSPYQPYIDALRQARERLAKDPKALGVHADGETPKSADEWFYEQYGPEFFALTQSMSRSLNGVPPTLEGYTANKKYKKLIEKYPEFGGLIVGSEGAGEFMGSVYDAQFNEALRSGSDQKVRDSLSFDESNEAYQKRIGWLEYSKFMDVLEAERVDQGLPSLNVKAARHLQAAKEAYVAKLKESYPDWHSDYSAFDASKHERDLAAMREIAALPELSHREDLGGLREYLEIRDAVTGELDKRKAAGGYASLDRHPDLQEAFDALVGEVVEDNLPFASLYYRYLDRDRLEADSDVQKAPKRAKRKGAI
jgi:hypothetical protein